MSLNQLTLDKEKNWLNIRVNDITVDGNQLGRIEEGTIQWSGAIGNSSTYKAEILGNVCALRLDINSVASLGNSSITSNNFPSSLIPSGSGIAEGSAIVVSNSVRVLGAWNITGAGQLQIQTINPTNNQLSAFSSSGSAGWSRPLILVYHLDQ